MASDPPPSGSPSGDDFSAPTSRIASQAQEHERLLMRYIAGDRDAELLARLDELIADDSELRDDLRDQLALDRILRQYGRLPLDPAPVLKAIAVQKRSGLGDQVMTGIADAQKATHTRRWWLGIAAATAALLVIGAFAATSMPGRGILEPVIESQPFASVHYVRDVVWPTDQAAPPHGARVAQGPLALDGGVIELRFDNGVVLAIEGPAQVHLLSRMQTGLRHGRLTTNVPPSAEGFAVVVDELRVIDLGTEAGIERAKNGHVHVQVYTGAVEIAHKDIVVLPNVARIGVGEARVFDPSSKAIRRSVFDAGRFVRTGPPRPLTLAVSDLIGGGDGRGTAIAEGLDPKLGTLRSEQSIGSRSGGQPYMPVPDLPFVDGVFVPHNSSKLTTVSSVGHTYAFPVSGSICYDIIRRGGFMIRPPDGGGVKVPTRSPTVINGVDHATFGHHLIGMHANVGVTIDLHALAQFYGRQPTRFTSVVANTVAPPDLAQPLAWPSRKTSPGEQPVTWTVLEPRTINAVAGSTLTRQDDHSVLAWPVQDTDTYVITGTSKLRRISALRLEVLSDPALPNGGPGAAADGNFILTHVRAAVITASARTELVFTGVVADFNQVERHCTNMLLGNPNAGWSVLPQTGRSHQAVFFCNPVELAPGAQVEISLAQGNNQQTQHVIGKFRLALTDASDPVQGHAVGGGSFIVLVDGKLRQRTVVPTANQAPARLEVMLTPTDRFLTLVSCDGGSDSANQWMTLGDPQIELVP